MKREQCTRLVFDRVSKTYFRGGRHRVDVLRNVSFEIRAGEFVSVLGDAMSGKTTMLRLAAGLEAPDAGGVLVAGSKKPEESHRVASIATRRRRRSRRQEVVGFDAQVVIVDRHPPPDETLGIPVLDLVAVPLLETMHWRTAQHAVTEALGMFELGDIASARWPELSDVERMLVRVAQAVARRPLVLLVDDPMHGLGLAHVAAVLDALRRTANEHDAAVLMTVGELTDAEGADAVWSLSAGSLVKASGDRGRVVDFPAGRGGA